MDGFVQLQGSPRTKRVYGSDLTDLVSFVDRELNLPLYTLQEEHALRWRQSLEGRGLAPATIARKLAVARGFFSYVLDLDSPPIGLALRNPFRRVRPPRFDRSAGKTPCPGPQQVARLLGQVSQRSLVGRRDLLILLLLFNQGLRVSEVANLKRSNILRNGRQTYLALVGKGGSEVRSVLRDDVAKLLDRHVQSIPPGSDILFTRSGTRGVGELRPLTSRAIHGTLRRYAIRAGLNPATVRPHSGRVYFITQSYLLTRDLERVARAVGHRELATTRRYLRLGSALEDHPATLINIVPKSQVISHRAKPR